MPTDHTAPAPPPAAPRRVPFAALGWGARLFLLFGGIWLLVGFVLVVVFTLVGGPIWDDWAIDERGVRTDAQPLSIKSTRSTRNHEPVFAIRYRFSDGAGEEHEATSKTASPQLIARARNKQPIHVEYDPLAPARRVRLAGETASFFGKLILMPMGFSLVGLLCMLPGYWIARRDRRVYRHGKAVRAEVSAVSSSARREHRRPLFRVEYSFQASSGPMTGQQRTAHPPKVGDQIWVIYDPDPPHHSVAVPPARRGADGIAPSERS